MYGPKIGPTRETTSVSITTEDVQKCLAEVAPLTTPHKDDGWRAEHLSALCKDPDCATTFTTIISAMAAGVTDRTCDIVSSATLVIILKKTEEKMETMKRKQGPNYIQPQRPLGMGNTIPKVAANCILAKVQHAVAVSAGAHQIAINAKGGCNMIQWDLQIIIEAEPDLARACLDASNAFGDMERPCIRGAIEANVALHPLIPMYDVLYTRGHGELWYYDEWGNFVMTFFCSKGVRQGCVMGTNLMCITMRKVYDALLVIMGPEGFLYNYVDDVYMGGTPRNVALALASASELYALIGLSLGWGPRKTEL
jgi:hypothetical protein